MPFNLNFSAQNGRIFQLQLEPGQMLFVLGANGTGKSSLMHRFAQQNPSNTRKISAHRQNWMNSEALDMTPAAKVETEKYIQNEDRQQWSRYRDQFAAQRASMTIYNLIDAENVRARAIAAAFDAENLEGATAAAKVEAPLTVINELLRQSNIPVTITIRANERVMASKDGGPEYSAAELSDGERNALLIAGNVLTAPAGSLLIIDEPERHLHRSIISPLLSQLFERRSDCGFVISTHDHDLPLEVSGSRTLLLRACNFNGQNVEGWEADELPADTPIDDILKRDLLGARRKVLFIEGTESSLDKPLYSLIFPMVSVIPKGSCRDVEHAVVGSRAGEGFHWLRAFGIADGDGYTEDQIEAKRQKGVYALPFYSVEAIYFHPQIIQKIAARQANVSGDDEAELTRKAVIAGIDAIAGHTNRLSQKVAKKAVRQLILEQLPNDNDLLDGQEITVSNDAPALHAARKAELDAAVEGKDWESILTKCPVRESVALANISSALGFRKIEDYEKAVRRLLSQDDHTLTFVRSLFGNLFDQLDS
ncbi:AAA family ATPase [Paenirhodobacter populi]|uniref:AAA family ATPase n=1 Tax=Paenirhodobacter populi TaxID=2306993 RepID=UPI000FE3D243|nr:AAA family ATPase [Sinirhodobacter populi]RWR05093.1 ATP-binding cassette domain-containing protein [Sinirhodobacter populi]